MDIGQVRIPTLSRDGYERRAERITVRVRNVSCEGVGGGSGFAIDRSTLITNRHVVAGASEDRQPYSVGPIDSTKRNLVPGGTPKPSAKPRTPARVSRRTPRLPVPRSAIDFYARVLGASDRMRMAMPDGAIPHAELEIGGSIIMIGDELPGGRDPSPKTLGGSPTPSGNAGTSAAASRTSRPKK